MKATYVIIKLCFTNLMLGLIIDDDVVCTADILQGVHAVVEFANQGSVASLLEEATVPDVSHEAVVPFKSRLLSLKNLGSSDPPSQQLGPQCQPQTAIPINQLIQRLSGEESVSMQICRFWFSFEHKSTCEKLILQGLCFFPLDRPAVNLPDRSLSANRGEQPTPFSGLLPAQGHSCCLFPRMHHQAIWFVGERLWKAGLRP